MPTMIVRHRVKDYEEWKKVFLGHAKARAEAGFKGSKVYRYSDDPNHLIVVFKVEDIRKAEAFGNHPDCRKEMEKAGVIDEPKLFYLDDGEEFPS